MTSAGDCSSLAAPEEDEINEDIRKKMELACNVLQACQHEAAAKDLTRPTSSASQRTAEYTKCDRRLFIKANFIYTNMCNQERNTTDWDDEETLKNMDFEEYETFRNVYIDKHLNQRKIPGVNSSNALFTLNKRYVSVLTKSGFMWANIPNTNRSMIVERPRLAQRRMDYLSKIIAYRNSGKNIIYAEERTVTSPITEIELYVLYPNFRTTATIIASKNGKMLLLFYKDIKSIYIYKALINALQEISVPSVVVLAEKSHHDKNIAVVPPKASDSKQKMIEFLSINDIPHDPDMHRAELYTLIQQSKHNCIKERYKLDAALNALGHEVLRRPPFGLSKLNFFKHFWTALSENMLKNETDLPPEVWEKMETDLIAYERKIYTEDLQVEEILDRIQTMALDGKIHDTELSMTNNNLEEGNND